MYILFVGNETVPISMQRGGGVRSIECRLVYYARWEHSPSVNLEWLTVPTSLQASAAVRREFDCCNWLRCDVVQSEQLRSVTATATARNWRIACADHTDGQPLYPTQLTMNTLFNAFKISLYDWLAPADHFFSWWKHTAFCGSVHINSETVATERDVVQFSPKPNRSYCCAPIEKNTSR